LCGTRGLTRTSIDQVSDSFGLQEIKFVIKEGPFGKLAGPGHAGTEREDALEQDFSYDDTAMALQLEVVSANGPPALLAMAKALVGEYAAMPHIARPRAAVLSAPDRIISIPFTW